MKNLVIVESGAKATKITEYLDKNFPEQQWEVAACLGHIRDLPDDESAVNPENWVDLSWEETQKGKKTIRELRKICKTINTVYLATDPDREGEAIAWHLYENLNLTNKDYDRIVFHEITKNAILAALPGAFVPISAALLELKNNNNKRVLVPQATRVIFIVCMLPVIFIYQMGNAEIQGLGNQNIYDLKYFIEIVLVCFACYIFALFLKKFNIPSSTLLSGMIISGILYTLEFVNARFPDIFINISFIFLGTALGSRLNGLKIKELLFYIFLQKYQ